MDTGCLGVVTSPYVLSSLTFLLLALLGLLPVGCRGSVTCADCTGPGCDHPGICQTDGKCFLRRDVNGLLYRGCADGQRWGGLDLGYDGCRWQHYLGWSGARVFWCLCDKPGCNNVSVGVFMLRNYTRTDHHRGASRDRPRPSGALPQRDLARGSQSNNGANNTVEGRHQGRLDDLLVPRLPTGDVPFTKTPVRDAEKIGTASSEVSDKREYTDLHNPNDRNPEGGSSSGGTNGGGEGRLRSPELSGAKNNPEDYRWLLGDGEFPFEPLDSPPSDPGRGLQSQPLDGIREPLGGPQGTENIANDPSSEVKVKDDSSLRAKPNAPVTVEVIEGGVDENKKNEKKEEVAEREDEMDSNEIRESPSTLQGSKEEQPSPSQAGFSQQPPGDSSTVRPGGAVGDTTVSPDGDTEDVPVETTESPAEPGSTQDAANNLPPPGGGTENDIRGSGGEELNESEIGPTLATSSGSRRQGSTLAPLANRIICPPTFIPVPHLRSCYHVDRSPQSWYGAAQHCTDLDPRSHLVTLDQPGEYEYIVLKIAMEPMLLRGWQGWWTSGFYDVNIREFTWSSSGHVISRLDPRWRRGLVLSPYSGSCVWLVPLAGFRLGNYGCRQGAGAVCEINV